MQDHVLFLLTSRDSIPSRAGPRPDPFFRPCSAAAAATRACRCDAAARLRRAARAWASSTVARLPILQGWKQYV